EDALLLGRLTFEEGGNEGVLAWEVLVHGSRAHAGDLGDPRSRRLVEARLGEDARGGLHDGVVGRLRTSLAGDPALARHGRIVIRTKPARDGDGPRQRPVSPRLFSRTRTRVDGPWSAPHAPPRCKPEPTARGTCQSCRPSFAPGSTWHSGWRCTTPPACGIATRCAASRRSRKAPAFSWATTAASESRMSSVCSGCGEPGSAWSVAWSGWCTTSSSRPLWWGGASGVSAASTPTRWPPATPWRGAWTW